MLTGPSGTAPARAQQTPRRRKQDVEILKHLRLLAREHQVCYEIWAGWSPTEPVTQRAAGLLLCADGHAIRAGDIPHAVPCCQNCTRTYSELREIAEWVLQLKPPKFRHEIFSFDCALHLAPPHRNHRREVVITVKVFNGFNQTAGNQRCESECLKEVRTRLSKLGIREDVLPL